MSLYDLMYEKESEYIDNDLVDSKKREIDDLIVGDKFYIPEDLSIEDRILCI